jgi:hypothetical protein
MRLGELVWPDKKALEDYWKVTKHDSVELLPEGFSFFLPGHKADRFFKGNRIIIQKNSSDNDPDAPFHKYLTSHDKLFPFPPQTLVVCGWFYTYLVIVHPSPAQPLFHRCG